jgi:hypothetical protein
MVLLGLYIPAAVIFNAGNATDFIGRYTYALFPFSGIREFSGFEWRQERGISDMSRHALHVYYATTVHDTPLLSLILPLPTTRTPSFQSSPGVNSGRSDLIVPVTD